MVKTRGSTNKPIGGSSISNRRRSSVGAMNNGKKDQTLAFMEKKEAEREQRRRMMKERKQERAEEEQRNIAAGNPGDVDFIGLVRKWREQHSHEARTHDESRSKSTNADGGGPRNKICICVRKRPISDKEREKNDHDSVTCLHPVAWVHSAKFRVDGITKYLDHNSFGFDHAFDENISTEDVYRHSTMPLIDFVCSGKGGRATVFAYGQTGSGKTYTMEGIQELVSEDLFLLLAMDGSDDNGGCSMSNTTVTVAFFEIYGGYIQDLLNNRERLKILEDGKGEIVVSGLEEFEANDPKQFLDLVECGNNQRTTHATEKNDTSSRSHAICQIMLRDKKTSRLRGKLSLVDLAGSERGSDTKSHNSQRRTESAEINTSLLALKECIRALDMNKTSSAAKHVPYRASNLTKILKDCFTSKLARTTMIATLSPGASSADHTLNTLRYADRIKEKKVPAQKTISTNTSSNRSNNSSRRKSTFANSGAGKNSFDNNSDKDSQQENLTPPPSPLKRTIPVPKKRSTIPVPKTKSLTPPDRKENESTISNGKLRLKKKTTVSPQIGQEKTEEPTTPPEIERTSTPPPSMPSPLLISEESSDCDPLDDLLVSPTKSVDSGTHSNDEHHVNVDNDCDGDGDSDSDDAGKLRRIEESLFDEEENLLNLHMNVIQESAQLLTEESKMLQGVQGEDVSDEDIDRYASRLGVLLDRKMHLIEALQEKIGSFRTLLKNKKEISNRIA